MPTEHKGIILVVDDNPFNRDGLALYLENAGYHIREAGDAATALAIAQSQALTGAVVDIVIPTCAGGPALLDMSVGIDLVGQLKHLNPLMGIVVFSAYDDRGSEVLALVSGGQRGLAYMLKGGRPERLLAALEQTMGGSVVLDPHALTNTRHLDDQIRRQLSPEERPWVERAAALMPTLTDRELEVAMRLANSQNLHGIAQSLGLAQSTVETHVTNLYNSLELSGVDEEAPNLRKSTLLAKACMLYDLRNLENRRS